ncbi:MAG: DAK2 domain-containing protein [Acidimicrobiales bacterium]
MDRSAAPAATALDARGLAETMIVARDLLARHQSAINRLNVYPVPDGDTGTNMLLTLGSVVDEVGPLESVGAGAPAMQLVCAAVAHGSLMGARGNSGVILCQVLRGLVGPLATAPEGLVGAGEIAAGLADGAAAARQAVLRPVEGTMLSVADAAAAAAGEAVRAQLGLAAVLGSARAAAVSALWRTPEQLPVLAKAGVVDAGGAGFLLLLDAFGEVVTGEAAGGLELPPDVLATLASGAGEPQSVPAAGTEGVELRYEVMYLLDAPDEAIPAFKEVWAGVGDSIVVVGGSGLWNCHIHTDDIGAAIEAALDAGRPREIRVTDLVEQVEEEEWVRRAETSTVDEPSGPPPVTSVVAVATGDGVRRIFRSLGVGLTVAGGQSMNPSTAEILAALEAVPAGEVVLLPNNSNIIPVAEQAALRSTKRVRVVPTRGVQEGFAALLEYDPQASVDENAVTMTDAASRIVAGEVTRAVRAADSPVGAISAGDFIGLSRSGVESVAATLAEATCKLIDRLVGPGHEIVTMIEGEGSSVAERRKVTEWIRAEHPELSVERHSGGQPLYPFLLSVE